MVAGGWHLDVRPQQQERSSQRQYDAQPWQRSGGRHHTPRRTGLRPEAARSYRLLATLVVCLLSCACLLHRLHARICFFLLCIFFLKGFLCVAACSASRVFQVNPNPNPKCRVPEMSGFIYFEQISGWSFQNSKFKRPEKSDPKFSGNPNAQA